MAMDVQRALAEGEAFVKNAEDELSRKILREDQLYFIDNQVEAIDTFLADTEDLQGDSGDVRDLRQRLREMKAKLERKSMEFLAEQEGGDLPEDVPEEEMAEFLVGNGQDLIAMVDEALGQEIKKVDQLSEWEDPLVIVNGFLADSEPYVHANPDLGKVRTEMRSRKRELEKRIRDVIQDWRASDLAGGDDDE